MSNALLICEGKCTIYVEAQDAVSCCTPPSQRKENTMGWEKWSYRQKRSNIFSDMRLRLKALERMAPYFEKIKDVLSIFSERTEWHNTERYIDISTGVETFHVNIYLKDGDSIRDDIFPLMEGLEFEAGFQKVSCEMSKYLPEGYVTFVFQAPPENENDTRSFRYPRLYVNAHFKRTTKCIEVPTGEMRAVTQLVCI